MKRNIILISLIMLVSLLLGCEEQFEPPVPLTQEEIHGIRMEDTQANNSLSNRDIAQLQIMAAQLVNAVFNVGDDHVVRGLDVLLSDREQSDRIANTFKDELRISTLIDHKIININMDSANRGALLIMSHVEFESFFIEKGEYIMVSDVTFGMTGNGFVAEYFEILFNIEYKGGLSLVWDETRRSHRLVKKADTVNYEEVTFND